ncbi:MAG: DPP IV N-terminal domain-containing protein [Chloroflexi bacterium]|nr:DPP IV N-terminal domain-containing protein [Chloroflexota bacterium]
MLFLLADKSTVVIFNTSTYQSRQFLLPTPIEPINVFWSVEDQNVFLQTVEGEIWWLSEFTDVSPHEPITPLDLAVRTAFWNPQHDTLVMLTKDNSLWAIHNMSTPTITQLTASLPDIHTVRWSPDGHHVAFVNGSDIYIISPP